MAMKILHIPFILYYYCTNERQGGYLPKMIYLKIPEFFLKRYGPFKISFKIYRYMCVY